MNLIVLTGNLTQDPEMRYANSGKAVTTFRIAINEGYGENRTTLFLNCESWEKLAESVAEYTRKGRKVLVTGSLVDDSWTNKEGKKVTQVKVKCRNVEFLDRREDGDAPAAPAREDDLSDLKF